MNLIKHIFTSCSYTSCLAYRPKVKKTFQVGCGIWIMTFGHQFYIWASFINSFGPFLKFGLFWLLGPHRERGRHEFRVELFRLVFRLQRDQVPITYYSFLSFFLKKWAILGLFIVYFQPFQTNITTFYSNIMWKMSIQYLVPGFEPTASWTWASSHNHWTSGPALIFYILSYPVSLK